MNFAGFINILMNYLHDFEKEIEKKKLA